MAETSVTENRSITCDKCSAEVYYCDECEAEIAAIVASSKISFEPGSATIDAAALGTMDDIAQILRLCGDLKLEIQGHTDSQGQCHPTRTGFDQSFPKFFRCSKR